MKFDYLIVGAGLFGATLAQELTRKGKTVLVAEKKENVGGMCYTEIKDNITVHKYGAHIFRTDDKELWDYVNNFATFKPFINSPLSFVDGELYNLPFNMNTFKQLWGVVRPEEAKGKIADDLVPCSNPKNVEEKALSMVGKTIYEKFIKEYTEKQWGRKCTELPASILGRIPIRYTYDNNYYSGKPYQGVPVEGYSFLIRQLLDGSVVITDVKDWRKLEQYANKIIYTGSIDEYFSYSYGKLEYRSLYFEEYRLTHTDNANGNAVINFPSLSVDYTREIEHKHFLGDISPVTILSREFPCEYDGTNERYYPIATEKNLALYKKYASLVTSTVFAGRLGYYKYIDMEQTMKNAKLLANKLCK